MDGRFGDPLASARCHRAAVRWVPGLQGGDDLENRRMLIASVREIADPNVGVGQVVPDEMRNRVDEVSVGVEDRLELTGALVPGG